MKNVYEQLEEYRAKENIEKFLQLASMDYQGKVSHAFERAKSFVKDLKNGD